MDIIKKNSSCTSLRCGAAQAQLSEAKQVSRPRTDNFTRATFRRAKRGVAIAQNKKKCSLNKTEFKKIE